MLVITKDMSVLTQAAVYKSQVYSNIRAHKGEVDQLVSVEFLVGGGLSLSFTFAQRVSQVADQGHVLLETDFPILVLVQTLHQILYC